MTVPLSLDLRRRLVQAVERGASIRGAARHLEVSPSAAIKLMERVRRTGNLAPGRIGGHRKPALADHADLIRALGKRSAAGLLVRRRQRGAGPASSSRATGQPGLASEASPLRAGDELVVVRLGRSTRDWIEDGLPDDAIGRARRSMMAGPGSHSGSATGVMTFGR